MVFVISYNRTCFSPSYITLRTRFQGGFIASTYSYVLGYLITALIDEFALLRSIDFVVGLRRRFYRISVPPLVFMVLVCTPFLLLVRTSEFISRLVSDCRSPWLCN